MKNIKEMAVRLGSKFPDYIDGRMPYTFHHDCMRSMYPEKFQSRADVAQAARGESDEHLYSVAFYHLARNTSITELWNMFDEDELKEVHALIMAAERNIKLFVEGN